MGPAIQRDEHSPPAESVQESLQIFADVLYPDDKPEEDEPETHEIRRQVMEYTWIGSGGTVASCGRSRGRSSG